MSEVNTKPIREDQQIDAMTKWYFVALLPSKDIAEDSVIDVISEISDQLNRDDTFEMNLR